MKVKILTLAAVIATSGIGADASNFTKDNDKVILHAWSWSFNTLAENMKDIAHIEDMRYKMSVAFVLYRICNKEELGKCDVETFLRRNNEFQFNDKLFESLEERGINKSSFLKHNVTKLILDLLSEFYEFT